MVKIAWMVYERHYFESKFLTINIYPANLTLICKILLILAEKDNFFLRGAYINEI